LDRKVREIGVGIRIDPNEGISFSGIEEVNGLINRGGKVTSIEPGGALMRKLGEDDDNVRLTLSGCEMKVIIDDSGVEASAKTLEHNRLYKEGSDLISPYMQLVNRASKSADRQSAQADLERGIELLNQAIAINPANWSAYWIIGKAHQTLGNSESACDAFGKSYGLHKANADVAREYMFECLNLGRAAKGIVAARHAVTLEPENAGLVANLALALLIGGQLEEAAATVTKAMAIAPDDEICHNLKQMIADVQAGRRPQPSKMADLNAT
jgi:tetratricopeptide (TPR) repeat protein